MKNKKKIIILVLFVICLSSGTLYFVFFNNVTPNIIGGEKAATAERKVTAAFKSEGLDYIEKKTVSCNIKAGNKSCKITLPVYNAKGSYSFFWSRKKLPSKDLTSVKWDGNYFFAVGSTYELTENTTFYPNTNNFHFDWAKKTHENYKPYFKYRNFDIIKTEKIGKTIFEFEKGIPEHYINRYITQVKQIYLDIPWIFVPGKVFALTEKTYNNYSREYGLFQSYYQAIENWKTSVGAIDLKYDTFGNINEEIPKNSISINATIHELAHAWDAYYRFCNRKKSDAMLISETTGFLNLYDSVKKSGVLFKNKEGYINKIEFFAGMVSNYYWHILQRGPNKPYYALKDNKILTNNDKNSLKTLIEKYANITKKY